MQQLPIQPVLIQMTVRLQQTSLEELQNIRLAGVDPLIFLVLRQR